MADTKPVVQEAAKASSVPALVTFWLLAIWSGMIAGVFTLVGSGVTVSTVMFGLLSGVFGTETTLLVAATSFWVGSTVGARASGDALAESNKAGATALATLAGAAPGAPDPTTDPQPVVIQQPEGKPVPVTETPDPFKIKP